MKKTPPPPSILPSAAKGWPFTSGGGIGSFDITMDADDGHVYDALCVLQAPSGMTRASELLTAADIRTQRGTSFNPVEVRRLVDRLLQAGHVTRDSSNRLRAASPRAEVRFRELMRDPKSASAWFGAWRDLTQFDRPYSMGFQEHEQLAAALRLVIFGGKKAALLEKMRGMSYTFAHMWPQALREAVLSPFDAELFGGIEPALQAELAERLMLVLSGYAEPRMKTLEDWALARLAAKPAVVTPALRARLVETLMFRGDFAAARALGASIRGAGVDLALAAVTVAEGNWERGAAEFEVALKQSAIELGRRKNVASPSLAWMYVMALLAQPTPAGWTKARKFAASESGKREADPETYWGIWQDAIDQRLGDARRAPRHFPLTRADNAPITSLDYLHYLLLAAWLRIRPENATAVRQRVAELVGDFEREKMAWLATLARRAAASVLGEAPSLVDAAAPFFVGEAQDDWRDALASILALGDGAAGPSPKREKGAEDRLIWIVDTDADGRLTGIEPNEQKAGTRGLGKPKAVSLVTLQKRTDLSTHDAAMMRAVVREEFGNRPVIDVVAAAPAFVGHPFVAWRRDPGQFIEITEGLPALEVMTQGEHIAFRLLDPVRTAAQRAAEAQDENYPQRTRQIRARLRNVMLLADDLRHARLVRLTPAQLRVAELVSQGWKVPIAAREELDAALRVLATHFQVASDAEAGHDVEPSRLLRAELTPQGTGLRLSLLATPFGDFGPRLAPGTGRERVTTVHQGATLSTRRDLAHESAIAQRLLEAIDFLDEGVHDWVLDEPQQALAVVEGLSTLNVDIVTEWPKGKPMRVRSVGDSAVRLQASSKGDWLELDGEMQLDGGEVLRLRTLLDMMRDSRSRYVALGDGDFLALGDALRQQLSDLSALSQVHGKGQRLSGAAALAWEASGHALQIEGDAAWRRRSEAWARAQESVHEVPGGLAAELRDYQLEGMRWMMRLGESGFGAVLADDMGLGKTVQTLAMLLHRAAGGPSLVVAPTSVCGNWLVEAARFALGLQVELYGDVPGGDEPAMGVDEELSEAATEAPSAGPVVGAAGDAAPDVTPEAPPEAAPEAAPDSARRAARRRQVRALGPNTLLVCSYALLQIDSDILAEPHWHTMVLDEAQAIKNPLARRSKAALALQGDFRLALTGTPIENRLGDLWSVMAFCNPGLLGTAEQFGQRFTNQIARDDDPQIKAAASRRLRRLLSPFLLRRTKAEVLTDLPPRTEIVHEVVPGARERTLLEALRQQAEESVAQAVAANAKSGGSKEGQNQFHVLAALTRLRRAACDPRLVAPELGIVGAKVQEFERLAVELVAGRHKALVFSQFTDFLALLRERLDQAGLSYQYLDGSTPAAERTKRVAAFQAGTGDLFLISLKAGGFGLNLTVADYVIIADPWWNPASEEQASARAHRIGQQRPVTVYRLVTQGSIEEKIVKLHRSKRDLAEGILSGQDASSPVDAGQLMELLRAG